MLPEAARTAVEKLQPGQVSRPVELDGKYHLFLLEAWPAKEQVDGSRLRDRAREELRRIRSAEAAARLLARLEDELEVRLRTENLPFVYVPE